MQTGEFLEFNDRLKAAEQYGAPYYTFHRADLLDALASGLDHSAIHLGHRLTGLEERSDRVVLAFANGAQVEAEYVIGADGVRSVIRQALYGDDNPTYTGQMVWRSLLNGSDVPEDVIEPTGHIQWVGPGCHLLAYYIRGKKLVNIVTQEDTDKWVEEGWSTRGDPDEMRLSFPNPEPRLKKLLSLVTECSKWGLFTRPLTQNWGRGRIQLIGDAAHAMLPNAGQGACQAFEDSYILARWLDACRDPVEAFANFRRIRIPRVHGVQRLSISNARFKHMRDSDGAEGVDRRRQRQRSRQLRMGLGLRSHRRMGQGARRSHRLCIRTRNRALAANRARIDTPSSKWTLLVMAFAPGATMNTAGDFSPLRNLRDVEALELFRSNTDCCRGMPTSGYAMGWTWRPERLRSDMSRTAIQIPRLSM